MEEWIDSKRVYEGKVVSVRVGNVLMGERIVAFREVVEHPGGVAIVPMLKDKVVLIRQFRVAVGRNVIEVPAGKLEGAENPLERARCELEEETGYQAGRLIPVGSVFASVGYSSEEIRLFLAFDLKHVGQKLEHDEQIEIVEIPVAEIQRRLDTNGFKDAKTVVGLQALLSYFRNHPEETPASLRDPALCEPAHDDAI